MLSLSARENVRGHELARMLPPLSAQLRFPDAPAIRWITPIRGSHIPKGDTTIEDIVARNVLDSSSDFLTHLALGRGTDYLKARARAREGTVKHNSLLRTAETFGQAARGMLAT